MKIKDYCPICGSEKIIQDLQPENWICSNQSCMFSDVEKLEVVKDACRKVGVVFDAFVNMVRPKCTESFFIEAYIVPENVADSVLNPKT